MFYEMAEEAKSGEGAPDTKEAEALAGALNHTAERAQTLWFSFLTFMLYLAMHDQASHVVSGKPA